MRALVTGGMSGIGAATVARLRDAGYEVVIWDRTDGADQVIDVSKPDEVDRAAAALLDTGPAPDYVVINAGVGSSGLLIDQPVEDWQRVIDINLTGAWMTLRAAASAMVAARKPGAIVVVSSISGTLADRTMGAYCISKAGANMLAKVAAAELGVHGIRVNAVGPGATDTPLLSDAKLLPGWTDALSERTALGRVGSADDVAQAIVSVLGMEWVTGQVIHADGGLSGHSSVDPYGQMLKVFGHEVQSR